MNKQEIYHFLTERNIPYEKMEHTAVYNMEDLALIRLPHPEWEAKNLFVRDDKRSHYYLITVKGEKRVDLKEFRKRHGLRPLSLASAEELWAKLGLMPGSVSPFGVLNDSERCVQVYLDAAFRGGHIGVHPNENTATVWLRTEDLLAVIREHGNEAEYTEIESGNYPKEVQDGNPGV